jgi:hypothetical protein
MNKTVEFLAVALKPRFSLKLWFHPKFVKTGVGTRIKTPIAAG